MKAQGRENTIYEFISRWKLMASFEVKGTALPRKELTVHNKLGLGCATKMVWMLW